MIKSYRQTEHDNATTDRVKPVQVLTPWPSLFTQEQLREMRLMGPAIYQLRRQIYQALPTEHLEAREWLIQLNMYQQKMSDIVNQATGDSDSEPANW